jgi:hypothetical protein
MAYYMHIHRRAHVLDAGNDITPEEWFALLDSDVSLQLDVFDAKRKSEQGVAVAEKVFALWPSLEQPQGGFQYWRGTIQTKNPSMDALKKACEIAEKMSARVQGDEGEFITKNDI